MMKELKVLYTNMFYYKHYKVKWYIAEMRKLMKLYERMGGPDYKFLNLYKAIKKHKV